MWKGLITDTRVIAALDLDEAWENYVSASNEVAALLREGNGDTFMRYLYAEVAKQSLFVHFDRVEDQIASQ